MARPRVLAIDVGTGTQDILILEAGGVIENAVQLIMPSPTALLAERVKQATRDRVDLVLTGVTMGGGPDHWAVEAHLEAGLNVYATPDAARTFDDDLERVAMMGIRVVDSAAAANGARRRARRPSSLTVCFGRAPWGPRRADSARWGGSVGLFADRTRSVLKPPLARRRSRRNRQPCCFSRAASRS